MAAPTQETERAEFYVPDLPIPPFERLDIAVARLTEGDVSAATRALTRPATLSPRETKRMYERFGMKRKNPWMDAILSTVTNPVFILAALASLVWRVPMAGKVLAEVEGLDKFGGSGVRGLSRWITSALGIFKGTKALGTILKVERALGHWREKWILRFGDAVDDYVKAAGRPLSTDETFAIAAKLDKLDDATGWFSDYLRRSAVRRKLQGRFFSLTPKQAQAAARTGRVSITQLADQADEVGGAVGKFLGKGARAKRLTVRLTEAEAQAVARTQSLPADLVFDELFFNNAGFRRYVRRIAGKAPQLLNPIPLTKHQERLVSRLRRTQAEMYRELRGLGANLGDDAVEGWLRQQGLIVESIDELQYFPHVMMGGGPGGPGGPVRRLMSEMMTRLGRPAVVPSAHLRRRYGWLLPDREALRTRLGKYINPEGWKAYEAAMRDRGAVTLRDALRVVQGGARGDELRAALEPIFARAGIHPHTAAREIHAIDRLLGTNPAQAAEHLGRFIRGTSVAPQYTLHLGDALSSYVHRTMQMWAWGSTNALKEFAEGMTQLTRHQQAMLLNRYIPILSGKRLSTLELAWGEQAWRLAEYLQKPSVRRAFAKIPKGEQVRNWLYEGLVAPGGWGSASTVSGKTAGWFYGSTIGANPASAGLNLLQTPLTTLNVVGVVPMVKGWSRAAKGVAKYINYRLVDKLDDLAAMRKAFPEFMGSAVGVDPYTREMLRGQFQGIERIATTRWGRSIGKAKQLMFSMFQGTERWNRISSYYAGEAWASASKLNPAETRRISEYLVRLTQFPGEVSGKPYFTLGLPAPARQFMHFPLRYLEFLRTAPKGTLPRTAMTAVAMYNLAKAAGVDISRGLMFGALPLPQREDAPFYPFPIVPPTISVAGYLARAAHTGEMRGLDVAASLLVPGGVALRRFYRATWPKYARYSERREDGRIPVYTEDGRLVSWNSPMQLIGRSLGFYSMDQVREWALTEYLVKQRNQIREYRRLYAEALLQNNYREAEAVQREFKRRYPELGELRLHKRDMQNLKRRRENTRIQRLLRSFPKAYRPLFEHMYYMALPGQSPQGAPPQQYTPPPVRPTPALAGETEFSRLDMGPGASAGLPAEPVPAGQAASQGFLRL